MIEIDPLTYIDILQKKYEMTPTDYENLRDIYNTKLKSIKQLLALIAKLEQDAKEYVRGTTL